MKTILKTLSFIAILFSTLFFTSCSEDEDKTANEYIYDAFEEWYLWYDELPDVNPNDYDTYDDLIDAISVEQDRWSYAGSYTEITDLLEEGAYKGFGAGFVLDYDNQIKLTHVYDASPMGRIGATRGWIVESINGFTADNLDSVNAALNSSGNVDFVFTNLEANTVTATMQKEEFTMNTILHYEVIPYENDTVGYLVYDSFVEASEDELINVFEYFERKGINELIIDLRYNGGGLVSLATMLTGIIGGEKVYGNVISTMVHNDKKSSYNEETTSIYTGNTLDLDRVYFLTTDGTASASELLINNLKPYMDVILVGSTTHGKPVGMYVLSVSKLDLAILPICFKNVNVNGEGDYFDGLSVDIEANDDLSTDWGNTEEAMLHAALSDIVSATATTSARAKSTQLKNQKYFEYKGLNQYINAY